MALPLTLSEQLTHSTTRIQCTMADGSTGTGTGFFCAFWQGATGNVPAIVTNRHVVAGAVTGQFCLTLKAPDAGPLVGRHLTISLSNFAQRWIGHPDPSVDLCAMPIAPLLQEAAASNQSFFFISLESKLLPTTEELSDLGALEDILMIGYPVGIWDSTNNMPILRRGVTATHPNIDYEGRQEFLIDAACFPGSSGSPVFLFNTGGWTTRDGNIIMGGTRVKLLGVLYAGPQHTATGEIRVVSIPTQQRAVALSAIPTNLGFIIKASRLNELEAVIRAMLPK
ncbi:MAG: trypsin-like peptidase domain-containing protein [Gammaproteobacteria bacterium]|nr:trypsin-like peptidase domain-containing protein [Gammaproteobacteria bacterium]